MTIVWHGFETEWGKSVYTEQFWSPAALAEDEYLLSDARTIKEPSDWHYAALNALEKFARECR